MRLAPSRIAEFSFYLGNLLSEENVFASAIAHYETALSLRNDAAETHNMLGNACSRATSNGP
jgi:Flp pilus assembly protein TadD